MIRLSRTSKLLSKFRPAAVRLAAERCVLESLESRQLLTVVAVPGFTPSNQTGAIGTTGTVELTRFVDDNAVTNHTVRMTFPTGTVDIQTFDNEVPKNAANFLLYTRGGPAGDGYTGTYFHRFVSGFVEQGGSFYPVGVTSSSLGQPVNTTGQPTVTDEVAAGQGRHNTRGTLAFARLPAFQDLNGNGVQDPGEPSIPGGGPDSATSGFFFNLADNSANLDFQNGGFDVFGQVIAGTDQSGTSAADPVSVVDALTQLPTTQQVIQDAVVLEPSVTFHAVSDNPTAISVTDPVLSEGKLQLHYNGPVGSTANITVTATQPGQATPVTLQFTATVAEAPSLPVQIGGSSGNKSVTFTDADGTAATVTVKGSGTATVNFNGTGVTQAAAKGKVTVSGTGVSAASLAVTGSAANTSVTIVGKGGDGGITLGSLTTDGPVKAISAKTTSVTGPVTVGGAAGRLDLGGLNNTTITIGGAASDRPAALTLGALTNTSITSGVGLKSVKATSFAGRDGTADTLTAPSLGAITTTGDFTENLDIAGAIKSITAGGNLTGNVTAASVGSIVIKGSMTGAVVTLNQAFAPRGKALGRLTVGGTVMTSTVRTTGSIGAVAADSLNGATIFAGVTPGVTALPSTASDFANQASIGSVKVKTSYANSNVAADNLGKVALGTVNLNNSGNAFGLAADKIAAVTGATGPGVKFSLKKLDTPTDLQTQAQGLDLGDARINLV